MRIAAARRRRVARDSSGRPARCVVLHSLRTSSHRRAAAAGEHETKERDDADECDTHVVPPVPVPRPPNVDGFAPHPSQRAGWRLPPERVNHHGGSSGYGWRAWPGCACLCARPGSFEGRWGGCDGPQPPPSLCALVPTLPRLPSRSGRCGCTTAGRTGRYPAATPRVDSGQDRVLERAVRLRDLVGRLPHRLEVGLGHPVHTTSRKRYARHRLPFLHEHTNFPQIAASLFGSWL